MVKVPLKKNFDHFMPHQNLQCDQKAWIKSCPKSTENAAPSLFSLEQDRYWILG